MRKGGFADLVRQNACGPVRPVMPEHFFLLEERSLGRDCPGKVGSKDLPLGPKEK